MSLSIESCRAMAVKMLSQQELQSVHDKEERLGYALLHPQIAGFSSSSKIQKIPFNIKEFFGIPLDDHAQSAYSNRINSQIFELLKKNNLNLDMQNNESRRSFDWSVFKNNDIKYFYAQTNDRITPKSKAEVFGDD